MSWEIRLLLWLIVHYKRYTIIHACDFDTVLPALLMKLFFGKIVVYDIFDFYAEMLRSTPNWIVRMIRAVDLWAIGRADAVILADDSRREQIKDSDPKRVTVIYNSPRDVLSKLQVEVDRPSEGDASLRIAFVGLLHVERGLLELLEVLSRNPEWQLDLAGFGGDEGIILPVAKRLSNVVFHGRISYDKALSLMYRADALVATYDPRIPNHRYASPNKLFEAMMLAKPIVVARGTNMDRIVERWDCGLIVEYGNVMDLEHVLENLSADPALRSRLGSASRKAYEQEFNWEIMRQRLLDLYREL